MQLLLLLLGLRWCLVWTDGCLSDRNQDHRVRVSCVNQRLTALPEGIGSDTQVLVLSENLFSTLSWAAYSAFTELHELDLSHNHITALEPPGPVLEKLSVLRLSGNRLSGLGGLVFRCAPSLMEVYLDRNQIRSLHDGTFSELSHLEVINLSQNKLPALPARLLERVSSCGLKTFDLENNSISLMPDGFFSSKPELPYVYLSLNPWLCSCAVGYLHAYLNDQEHNVYKHDGPNNIVPGAEDVVCSRPVHLLNRPIMELEENDFCPPDPPFPRGDLDYIPLTVNPQFISQMPSAPQHSTMVPPAPASTKSWTSAEPFWVSESWIELWTVWEYFSITPGPGPVSSARPVPDIPTTESLSITIQTETRMSPTTAESQSHSPTSRPPEIQTTAEPITYNPSQPKSHTSKADPTTNVQTSAWADPTVWTDPTTDVQTPAWAEPTTDVQYPSLTDLATDVQTSAWADPTTDVQTSAWADPTTDVQTPVWADPTVWTDPTADVQTPAWIDPPAGVAARDEGGRTLPWCWWLFAGFMSMCVLSALSSCVLLLWLLRIYLLVYRRLKRHISARSDSGVSLRAYRRTENSQWRETEGEHVSFLALEKIKDVQAVFRSVLFVDHKEEPHTSSQIQLVSVADRVSDTEDAVMLSGEVFRKTLYRVISAEEEAGVWTEEEAGEGAAARYSLILREESGRHMQWLVGQWQLG